MGPLRPFRGGLFESPPQEAHLPFCRPLHISRVSLSLRYIMNLLHQDDFLTAKTRFCAGKIIVSKSEETSKQKELQLRIYFPPLPILAQVHFVLGTS